MTRPSSCRWVRYRWAVARLIPVWPATSEADRSRALAADKTQFLPDGMMPANGPATVLSVEKLAGKVKGTVNLAATYTNAFVVKANKTEGFTS